ncbi:MAG: SEC-C domain-containing protein, partial [Coriobacteriia bacterium]|nr:SEC-C domain-containing protein [Coriobacteriia bacterium]
CPDMVTATLLPFEGVIISDGLMYGDGIPFNESEKAYMGEELAKHAGEAVAWTADELLERARAHNSRMRERDFDELMSSLELEARQSREGEHMPAGFHRGKLAGLDPEERERRIREHFEEAMEAHRAEFDRIVAQHSVEGEPCESLEECLNVGMLKDELITLCKTLHVAGYSSKNKKGLAKLLVKPVSEAAEFLRNDLAVCDKFAFDLFKSVVEAGGRVDSRLDDLFRDGMAVPMRPYLFQFRHGDTLTTVMPVELRGQVASLDFEAIEYERSREEAVINCAEAMGEYYGLLTLREAHDLYREVVLDAYSLEDFISLLMREDSFNDLGFVLQQWKGDSYLMHFSVSDAHLVDLARSSQTESIEQNLEAIMREGMDGPTLKRFYAQMQQEYDKGLKELDRYREHVLEVRARTPRRPLDPAAAEGKSFDRFFKLPAVVALREFYDAHVPDAEDDFTFAERAVEDLVTHAVDMGDVDGYLDGLAKAGWTKCTEDEKLYERLVENAYGALPSWDFNGWSPQEILENMSGRKVFYNDRGEMLHPAPGDACPCGSGKQYRDCHGK